MGVGGLWSWSRLPYNLKEHGNKCGKVVPDEHLWQRISDSVTWRWGNKGEVLCAMRNGKIRAGVIFSLSLLYTYHLPSSSCAESLIVLDLSAVSAAGKWWKTRPNRKRNHTWVHDFTRFKPHHWLREPLSFTFLGLAELTAARACIQLLYSERRWIRQLEKLWLPHRQCWRTGCSTAFPLLLMGFENGNFHRRMLGLPGVGQFLGLP